MLGPDGIAQARVTSCLPVVLSTREVMALLDGLDGTMWLVAREATAAKNA